MSVLVVDDQPLNRILLGKLLRSLDLHVIEAGDGQAGLQAYLSHGRAAVSMVFMDIMMPVLDGIQAVLSIRSAESLHGWQPVPIVAFTSEDVAHGSPLWHECMDSGFNDVVSKPVDRLFATQLLCRFMPGLQQRCAPSDPCTGGSGSGNMSGSSSEVSSDDEVACACGERSSSCSKCGSSLQLADAAGGAVFGTATSQRASFGGSAFGGGGGMGCAVRDSSSAFGGGAFGGSSASYGAAAASSGAFGCNTSGGGGSGGSSVYAGIHACCNGSSSDAPPGPCSYASYPSR